MQRTRRGILDFLKRQGTATLEELSAALGVVPVTVRNHLNILERDNLVCYQEVRGKVGRPYYLYSLTPAAEEVFPKCYHTLANRLLDCLEHVAGEHCAESLATHFGTCWAHEYEDRLSGKSRVERIQEVAAIRTEEGACAEIEEVPEGTILRQYNCPCPCSAQRHPAIVCKAELYFLRTLLGPDVQRVSWQIDGDRTCAFLIPSDRECAADGPDRVQKEHEPAAKGQAPLTSGNPPPRTASRTHG